MIEDLPTEIYFFQKYRYFWTLTCNKKIFGSRNRKSGFITFCGIWCRFQNCLCFYSSIDNFWLLFFWRFKKHILKERQMYIYICTYCVLLGCFDAINASNLRTISSLSCNSVTTQNFIVLSYLHHPKAQILLCR